ncbi:copper homeostasis protein CutC [Rhodococcus sp. IEGM 1366]|uniref:copper homeostasis protein CutC n=1 Tax=Rhodococcus sp. IEGM 1366 TaxID=3082223 RepID=UPI0029536F95|nr:copper homeostasis protein CutC [Rhodococcus sp. IEGM 1366]MDV8070450.1 copper homeostasis protein CutC [Rhodococcus sp. IEGM 1366]
MSALELAVQDVRGAQIALAVGAARVELCAALGATGGLTPSYGLIEAVVAVGVPVHVLIRPRAGGFVYSADEMVVICRDTRAAVAAGASGIVIGALAETSAVDVDAMRSIIDCIDPSTVEVTAHRAVDVVPDRNVALDILVDLEVTRVLTSGGAPTCAEGLAELGTLVDHAAGRIQIMAGGGVRIPDIAAIVATGVDAIHLSARAIVEGSGGPGGGSGGYEVTDREIALSAASALDIHGHPTIGW